MAAADCWKQKSQKVSDIDPLSIPKHTTNVVVNQGFGDLLSIQRVNRKKRLHWPRPPAVFE